MQSPARKSGATRLNSATLTTTFSRSRASSDGFDTTSFNTLKRGAADAGGDSESRDDDSNIPMIIRDRVI
jgi:hypothetical protein